MICDKCGIDSPEWKFWNDECIYCHTDDIVKELNKQRQLVKELEDDRLILHRRWMRVKDSKDKEIKELRDQILINEQKK